VRIATFNINNINKRLDNLLAWLAKTEPDVVSLQELKVEQGAFPVNALRTIGTKRSGKGSVPGTVWPFLRGTMFPC
jgi:exodeoxyribonuclease III